MAVTMTNGTAPYKLQMIAGEVRELLGCKIAFSIAFPADNKNHTLVIKANGSSAASLSSIGTNPSRVDIRCRPKRQRKILSCVTYIIDEPRLDPL